MSGGWKNRGALVAYFFLVTATFGFLQPFLPLYMSAAGLTKTQIGLLSGVASGLALLIQPLLGRWSDRLDARRPFIAGSALAAGTAYLLFPRAQTLGEFLILTTLGANGTLFLNAAGGILVGRLAAAGTGGATYASFRVYGSVGFILVAIASGLLVNARGPLSADRSVLDPLFRYGPLLFFGIAAVALVLPDRRSDPEHRDPGGKVAIHPNLRRFLVAYFLYCIGLYGASPSISLFLKELGASGLGVTLTFIAGVVIEVLVMTRSGRLADAYGRRPLLALSFLLLPLRMAMYAPATGPAWVAAVQSLHGLNFGIVGAVAIAFANDHATERTFGRTQARIAATTGLASAVGPPLLGWFSDLTSLRGMFLLSAGIAAVAAALMVFGVQESKPGVRPLAAHGPLWLKPFLRLLDAPPR